MARKRKTTVMTDLVNIAALLPWWLALTLAPISYLILHEISLQPITGIAIADGEVKSIVAGEVKHAITSAITSIAKYFAPALFVMGALISCRKRSKRKGLFLSMKSDKPLAVLKQMSWQDFELLVGEYFRHKGFNVVENGGGGADGGIDLTVKKGGNTFIVQCKHWQSTNIPVNVVRETFGVMASKSAAGAFVVTSGDFTKQAIEFAMSNKAIFVINGAELAAMISGKKVTPKKRTKNLERSCPICSGAMVKRKARQGRFSGKDFWGCTNYPRCKGIVN